MLGRDGFFEWKGYNKNVHHANIKYIQATRAIERREFYSSEICVLQNRETVDSILSTSAPQGSMDL